jgi:squalene-associated FAD-dependent desaturase
LSRTVYVIGAGLAGLGAAVALAGRGERVVVLEAAAQAGGRCRSYHDRQLGMTIDNGNHLVLSGNTAVQAYLAAIGAGDRLAGPEEAAIALADFDSDKRWTVRPNAGPLPWWIFDAGRRTPGTSVLGHLALARLLYPPAGRRIDEVVACSGLLWRRLLQPFLLAVLNTEPEAGSAALAAAVLRETLVKGGQACRPRIASPTLAAAFVDPALDRLVQQGAEVRLGHRVRALAFEDGRLARIAGPDAELALAPEDLTVLAVPPWVAQDLIPGLEAPDEFRGILNAHFKTAPPAGAAPMVGLIGATAEWVFAFEDRISVTVSAADRLLDMDRESLAQQLWADAARLHGLQGPIPPWQIVKEKRATFAATPSQDARRPGARTRWGNLLLAGDWTATGLPATIEGALRSGRTAAELALAARVV